MKDIKLQFNEVWCVDFEFSQPSGELPVPICLVAKEFFSGRVIRLSSDELHTPEAPFDTGPPALFVAYYASAEIGCFQSLGWKIPERILDLCVELKNRTSGLPVPAGHGILGALTYFGLDALPSSEKNRMRELAMRGGPFSPEESQQLLDYCESDVDALLRLLPKMAPLIDLPLALLRGRYMAAVARMERYGIPIDVATLARLRDNWAKIQQRMIKALDPHGFWEGLTFKTARFADYLQCNDILWPRTEKGALKLDADTFKSMARTFPELETTRQLRHTLSELRLNNLAIGSDGRNRTMLSAFASRTGRNQPSNAKFIFGPATWLRGLIKPSEGRAIAYVDWASQESGVAAALSGDHVMQEAYMSGDPYLGFAKQARAVPSNATKESHPKERERFKGCVLAVQYGMGEKSLAIRLNEPLLLARDLLRLHRSTYRRYWEWSESNVDSAILNSQLQTVFGWTVHAGANPNTRSLANFPMQANGAEMMRLACCLATERGIMVCAPIHDALLVEGAIDEIDEVVRATQAAMAEASRVVLNGFELRTEAKIVRYPDRYSDKRGVEMWNTVTAILKNLENESVTE